jgi:glutathione S-transferase
LEDQLGDEDWFNGKMLRRSDVIISWPFDNIAQRGRFDLKDYLKIAAWRERIERREAWKRGLERGNSYKLNNDWPSL